MINGGVVGSVLQYLDERDESSVISVRGKIKRDARRRGENGKEYMNTWR